MLNTRSLGGVGVTFHVIILSSIFDQRNWEWDVRENKKGLEIL